VNDEFCYFPFNIQFLFCFVDRLSMCGYSSGTTELLLLNVKGNIEYISVIRNLKNCNSIITVISL
jgi:hypothetical protein